MNVVLSTKCFCKPISANLGRNPQVGDVGFVIGYRISHVDMIDSKGDAI